MTAARGDGYADLLRSRVTEPLGMIDTTFTPTPEQCSRLMIGSGLGSASPCVDAQATEGSGGLYSTGNNMTRWLLYNIDDTDATSAVYHAVYRQRQALSHPHRAPIGPDRARAALLTRQHRPADGGPRHLRASSQDAGNHDLGNVASPYGC